MSQQNVEKLRQIYAVINAGVDKPLFDFLHPDFVYRTREELPGGGEGRRRARTGDRHRADRRRPG